MTALKNANLVVAFVLELCALAALAYWGFNTGEGTQTHLVLGIGAPLIVAAVWGLFLAPRAVRPIAPLANLVLKLIVFGAASLALAVSGQLTLSQILAVVAAINLSLAWVWKQAPGLGPDVQNAR